jgi:hypothetical protein
VALEQARRECHSGCRCPHGNRAPDLADSSRPANGNTTLARALSNDRALAHCHRTKGAAAVRLIFRKVQRQRDWRAGIMKHRRFKYCSRREYAEAFLDGKVFCQTAAFFRDYEDALAKQIIGDEYEGTRLYQPLTGLEINNLKRSHSFTLNMGMECLTKAHEIYIFCMSLSFTDLLKKEFNAVACVEILDPRAFISRWLNALPEEAKQKEKHVARRVRYYKPEDVPGNVWALPDLIITTKLKRFAYQHEYRLAYTTTDAFAFGNCTYQLVDRKARPSPKPEEHFHQTLELGDLRDICRLHTFSSAMTP